MTDFTAELPLPTASPCVGICMLDDRDCCTGCGRLLTEIAAWPLADEPARRDIVIAAAARLSAQLQAATPRQ